MLRDEHAVIGLVVIGLIQMAAHPVKTWNMLVNGDAWHG